MQHPHTSRFWLWYEHHYRLHLTITVLLFLLQLVHLTWMGLHVIAPRLGFGDLFPTGRVASLLLIFVDYTEIPALLSTSFVYVYEMHLKFRWRTVFFLLALNIQWLHLFWITDEFVISQFRGDSGTILPVWLAWIAILIDYLEVPVIIDTIRKLVVALRTKDAKEFFKRQ